MDDILAVPGPSTETKNDANGRNERSASVGFKNELVSSSGSVPSPRARPATPQHSNALFLSIESAIHGVNQLFEFDKGLFIITCYCAITVVS